MMDIPAHQVKQALPLRSYVLFSWEISLPVVFFLLGLPELSVLLVLPHWLVLVDIHHLSKS